VQFPSFHKNPKQSFSLEQRLSFENAQESFEKAVEKGDSANNNLDKVGDLSVSQETGKEGTIDSSNLQNAITAIDTAAFEILKKTFQDAYKSDENTSSARARQALESFRAFALPIDIVDGQAKIDKYFQEYLTLFEKYNTIKTGQQRNMLSEEQNASTVPRDVQTWMTTKGYSILLKNDGDAIKKKLEGKVKRNGKPFDTAEFPNISLLEQTGKNPIVFETGIKDIRPITLDGNTVGLVILDGDGDLTKIDEHGISYVDSYSLEKNPQNPITTRGLLKGYRFGADGNKTTTDVGTEGLKPEEKEYKAGAKTFDGEKEQDNTPEAVKKREQENLPNTLRNIFQEILKNPEDPSSILQTLIPLVLAGDPKKIYDTLKTKFPVLPEIDDPEKAKLQANYQDFLASVIGIIPKTVQFFETGAISETALPKEQQKKALSLLATDLTGTQYEASQVPEITRIEIQAVDGNETLVVNIKDKGEIAFSATNVKFGGNTYEYQTGETKNPQIKTEVIDKIFSAPPTKPETDAPVATAPVAPPAPDAPAPATAEPAPADPTPEEPAPVAINTYEALPDSFMPEYLKSLYGRPYKAEEVDCMTSMRQTCEAFKSYYDSAGPGRTYSGYFETQRISPKSFEQWNFERGKTYLVAFDDIDGRTSHGGIVTMGTDGRLILSHASTNTVEIDGKIFLLDQEDAYISNREGGVDQETIKKERNAERQSKDGGWVLKRIDSKKPIVLSFGGTKYEINQDEIRIGSFISQDFESYLDSNPKYREYMYVEEIIPAPAPADAPAPAREGAPVEPPEEETEAPEEREIIPKKEDGSEFPSLTAEQVGAFRASVNIQKISFKRDFYAHYRFSGDFFALLNDTEKVEYLESNAKNVGFDGETFAFLSGLTEKKDDFLKIYIENLKFEYSIAVAQMIKNRSESLFTLYNDEYDKKFDNRKNGIITSLKLKTEDLKFVYIPEGGVNPSYIVELFVEPGIEDYGVPPKAIADELNRLMGTGVRAQEFTQKVAEISKYLEWKDEKVVVAIGVEIPNPPRKLRPPIS
jgi:hypothetical protein